MSYTLGTNLKTLEAEDVPTEVSSDKAYLRFKDLLSKSERGKITAFMSQYTNDLFETRDSLLVFASSPYMVHVVLEPGEDFMYNLFDKT